MAGMPCLRATPAIYFTDGALVALQPFAMVCIAKKGG